MNVFRITYVEDDHPFLEHDILILCNGLPTYSKILKRINMLDNCGEEMTNEDYKEFVVKLGNYKKYNIESVEPMKAINML